MAISQNQMDLIQDFTTYSCKRPRRDRGRADAAFVVADDGDDFVHVVGDFHEVEVAGADELVFFEARFHPRKQALPMFAAEQDERELRDALRLHEREDFKKFVERAEAAGHEHEAEAVFHEADFAREKIMKVNRDVGVAVAALLVRQFDVEADGFAAGVFRAFVRGFHDAGAAAGDDGEIVLGEALGDVVRGAIKFVGRLGARGAKNRHGRADLGQRLKRIHELGHDAEDAPRVFADEIVVAHGQNGSGNVKKVKACKRRYLQSK